MGACSDAELCAEVLRYFYRAALIRSGHDTNLHQELCNLLHTLEKKATERCRAWLLGNPLVVAFNAGFDVARLSSLLKLCYLRITEISLDDRYFSLRLAQGCPQQQISL